MAQEIERQGIPAALITALIPIAQSMGVKRIVEGASVASVMGDQTETGEHDRDVRDRILDRALQAVATRVDGPTVFSTGLDR